MQARSQGVQRIPQICQKVQIQPQSGSKMGFICTGVEVQKVHFLDPKGSLFWGPAPQNWSWLRAWVNVSSLLHIAQHNVSNYKIHVQIYKISMCKYIAAQCECANIQLQDYISANSNNNIKLYSCSPRRASRKLWTVYETVSCMQQLRERYALRTCYYARASLWRQRQGLNYAQLQPTVSFTLMHRF